jgi:hypothetical protein
VDIAFERDLSRNPALAASALWAAAFRFSEEAGSERGIEFEQMFIVLPIAFHRRSAESVQGKTMTEGSFYRAIAADRTLVVGLQERVQDCFRITLEAMNLAFASRLLVLDPQRLQIYPGRKSFPCGIPKDVKPIMGSAKRVGYWLAVTDFPVLCNLLRIRL